VRRNCAGLDTIFSHDLTPRTIHSLILFSASNYLELKKLSAILPADIVNWRLELNLLAMLRSLAFYILFALTNSILLLLYPFSWHRFFICAAMYTPGTLLMLYLLFHPRSSFLVENRSQVPTDGRFRIALTFDDGPNEQHTAKILGILAEKKIKAAFFVIGAQVLKNPNLAARIVAEGNQIASHTFSHPWHFCFLSSRRLRMEILEAQNAIARTCGLVPRYFRSPVGLRHPLLRKHLSQNGLEFISWRVRGFDSRIQDPAKLYRKITGKIKSGDIILLHDRNGKATDCMLKALPKIIDELKDRGFEFVQL
jgi:peptidoglycan-N-acetylglucosamine deacetylase